MTYEEMKQQLDAYNWDDGFDLPGRIISDENCDLALALQIFYLGDGFTYFQTYAHNIGGNKEWFCFIDYLYQEIKNGNYQKTGHHYRIPLSRVQRYQLAKNNIPDIFLTDI